MTEINTQKIIVTQDCGTCNGHGNVLHVEEDEHETFNNQYLGLLNDARGHVPSFLSVTNKFEYSSLEGLVYSGNIEKETDKLLQEQNQIEELTTSNVNEISLVNLGDFASKKIDFVKYNGISAQSKNLNKRTDTSKILSNLQYSDKFDTDAQYSLLAGSIKVLAEWLDECITSYNTKVTNGKENGDSEVKLSFLLRLRKAIENCDFPVGFGNDELFEAYSTSTNVILGEYSSSSNSSAYLNKLYSAENNNNISNHTNRSLLLNASAFFGDRTYSSEEEFLEAFENGEFDELKEKMYNGTISKSEITKAYSDIIMSSDTVYNNYRQVYLASVLAQELIRSTHISNEVISANTLELIQDDFKNKYICRNWYSATISAVQELVPGFDIKSLTYADAFIRTDNYSALGFTDLAAYNNSSENKETVLEHGHEENVKYGNYIYGFGFATENDDKNVLMNFIV